MAHIITNWGKSSIASLDKEFTVFDTEDKTTTLVNGYQLVQIFKDLHPLNFGIKQVSKYRNYTSSSGYDSYSDGTYFNISLHLNTFLSELRWLDRNTDYGGVLNKLYKDYNKLQSDIRKGNVRRNTHKDYLSTVYNIYKLVYKYYGKDNDVLPKLSFTQFMPYSLYEEANRAGNMSMDMYCFRQEFSIRNDYLTLTLLIKDSLKGYEIAKSTIQANNLICIRKFTYIDKDNLECLKYNCPIVYTDKDVIIDCDGNIVKREDLIIPYNKGYFMSIIMAKGLNIKQLPDYTIVNALDIKTLLGE